MVALEVARQRLPAYSHRCSPKVFTQHQLFACLVLKTFWKADYRGVVQQLADNPSLVELLGLKRVPHWTTLQKAARRLLTSPHVRALLDGTVRRHLGRRRRARRSAVDSTGLDLSAASGYFVRRRQRAGFPWKTVVYRHFAKLSVVCDVDTHFILAFRDGRGPKPDVGEFQSLLADALRRVKLTRITADAGYDSEPNHRYARDQCGVRTVIPPKHGRPTTKPASGRYRRLMQTHFDDTAYTDRVQVETVISMLKRRLESCVRGHTYWSQRRELRLKVLTHNIMILLWIRVFYRARPDPFLSPFLSPDAGRGRTIRTSNRRCGKRWGERPWPHSWPTPVSTANEPTCSPATSAAFAPSSRPRAADRRPSRCAGIAETK
jgi:hypothetical protein